MPSLVPSHSCCGAQSLIGFATSKPSEAEIAAFKTKYCINIALTSAILNTSQNNAWGDVLLANGFKLVSKAQNIGYGVNRDHVLHFYIRTLGEELKNDEPKTAVRPAPRPRKRLLRRFSARSFI